ncbi:hypothetical protein V7S43_008413 [Phytophthora oleae]|uniref:Uncharacterized protein n=1 Tax=Phytophthora oleae TaxID=2107226 RepID=A0ABD3FJ48_9STRA
MKRRINQTKSLFDTKKLAADAAKYRYLSEQLSKADRRMHVKHKCKELELQSNSKRGSTHSSNYSPSKPLHHRKRHHQSKNAENESELHTIHEFSLEQLEIHRDSIKLPRVRASHKTECKYATPSDNFPTVTNTTKLIRASDFLPRLGR